MSRRRWIKRPGRWCLALLVLLLAGGGLKVWQLRSAWLDAKHAYEAADYPRAIIAFQRVTTLLPEDAYARYWLGNALGFTGRLPQAVVEFRRAADLEPENALYHSALGHALSMAREYEASIRAYRKAAVLERDRIKLAEVHFGMANSFWRQKRKADAIREYRRALEIDPDCWRAREALYALEPWTAPRLKRGALRVKPRNTT